MTLYAELSPFQKQLHDHLLSDHDAPLFIVTKIEPHALEATHELDHTALISGQRPFPMKRPHFHD